MIQVAFFKDADGTLRGYSFSGHSDYAELGSDIVCAAVSSAAYLTANTITDIMGLSADISVEDGSTDLRLSREHAERAQELLRGLELHVEALSEQYSDDIQIREV